jgi:hypothetical protein
MNTLLFEELLAEARTLPRFTAAELGARAGVRLSEVVAFLHQRSDVVELLLPEGHDVRRPKRAFWRVRPALAVADGGFDGESAQRASDASRLAAERLLATAQQTAVALADAGEEDRAQARRDVRAALIYVEGAEGRLLDLREQQQLACSALERRAHDLRMRLLARLPPAAASPAAQPTEAAVDAWLRGVLDWSEPAVRPLENAEAGNASDDPALDLLQHLVASSTSLGVQRFLPALRAAEVRANVSPFEWRDISQRLSRAIARWLPGGATPGFFVAATLLCVELDHSEAGLACMNNAMVGPICRSLAPGDRALAFAAFSRLALHATRREGDNPQARACLFLLDALQQDDYACLLVPGALLCRLCDASGLLQAMPAMVFAPGSSQTRAGLEPIRLVRSTMLALHATNALPAFARAVPWLCRGPRELAWFRICVGGEADALIIGGEAGELHVGATQRITGSARLRPEDRAELTVERHVGVEDREEVEANVAIALTDRRWRREFSQMHASVFTRRLGERWTA